MHDVGGEDINEYYHSLHFTIKPCFTLFALHLLKLKALPVPFHFIYSFAYNLY